MCALAQVSRAGWYRRRSQEPLVRRDVELRDVWRVSHADPHIVPPRILIRNGR